MRKDKAMTKWEAETESLMDTGGTMRTKVIDPAVETWIYICPKNKNHAYSAPGWNPRNDELLRPQIHRDGDGTRVEGEPRINCPYCHVPRIPHLIKELIPFRVKD
jgi:hypothetical protein